MTRLTMQPHRDLNASNILLDANLNPKISDFGMARSFEGTYSQAMTLTVVGTYGYMPPEYVIDGQFSVKSDVFSFGVLLLKIVSGKRNRGFNNSKHRHNLDGHAWSRYREAAGLEVLDPLIVKSCIAPQVLRSIHIGLLCVQQNPDERSTMSSVMMMLDGDCELPKPNLLVSSLKELFMTRVPTSQFLRRRCLLKLYMQDRVLLMWFCPSSLLS